MKKALITGINGFVGNHLLHYLRQNDIEVYGSIKPGSEKRDSGAKELYDVDILNFEELSNVIRTIAPDYIFHLAALTSPSESFKAPQETVKSNIIGQINILQAVKDNELMNTKTLVVSSAEVYGNVKQENLPINENCPLSPTSPYAVSKIAQDFFGLQYFLAHKVQSIRVRPFNHIGPGQSPFFAIPSFAKQIASIEKGQQDAVIKVGNLQAKKDFTDVRDVVKAYLLLMEKGEVGDIYNIGSGASYKIEDILHMLLSFSAKEIQIEQDQSLMRPSEIPELVCDSSKLKNVTGWSPTIPIEDSLRDTLDYWRNSTN